MATFSAQDVQRLRRAAGVGMMDAKRALEASEGDYDRAFEHLREQGLAAAQKRAERAATDGTIGSYLHHQSERPVMGVLVELASETDFVAKSPEFQEAAKDIAMHVAWADPRWLRKEDVPEEELDRERELITRQARNEGKPDNVIRKIVEGRLNSFYEQHVLYEQRFVNADKFAGTVGELVHGLAAKMGENVDVRRIARLAVGEDI